VFAHEHDGRHRIRTTKEAATGAGGLLRRERFSALLTSPDNILSNHDAKPEQHKSGRGWFRGNPDDLRAMTQGNERPTTRSGGQSRPLTMGIVPPAFVMSENKVRRAACENPGPPMPILPANCVSTIAATVKAAAVSGPVMSIEKLRIWSVAASVVKLLAYDFEKSID